MTESPVLKNHDDGEPFSQKNHDDGKPSGKNFEGPKVGPSIRIWKKVALGNKRLPSAALDVTLL